MKNHRVGNVFLFAPIIKEANLNVFLYTVYFFTYTNNIAYIIYASY